MRLRLSSALAAVAVLAMPLSASAAKWEIDSAHSSVTFSVEHMAGLSNVRGSFQKFSGTIDLNEKDLAKSTVEATIDTASITTYQEQRDGHLKSPDFFDAAKNPNITFKSKKVEAAGKDKFKVTGDLTLHGVTKEVVLDVTSPAREVKGMDGAPHRGATATTKINRKEFGLGWNKALETGGVMVGEDVTVTVDAELVNKAAAAPAAPAKPAPAPAAPKK